jgi:hypothetical protein
MNDLLNIARSLAAERKKKVEVAKANIADITIDLTQLSISKEYKYQYIRAYIPNVPLYGIEPVDVFMLTYKRVKFLISLVPALLLANNKKRLKQPFHAVKNASFNLKLNSMKNLIPS